MCNPGIQNVVPLDFEKEIGEKLFDEILSGLYTDAGKARPIDALKGLANKGNIPEHYIRFLNEHVTIPPSHICDDAYNYWISKDRKLGNKRDYFFRSFEPEMPDYFVLRSAEPTDSELIDLLLDDNKEGSIDALLRRNDVTNAIRVSKNFGDYDQAVDIFRMYLIHLEESAYELPHYEKLDDFVQKFEKIIGQEEIDKQKLTSELASKKITYKLLTHIHSHIPCSVNALENYKRTITT